jgi:CBS domain containing-hemolysin-like protein
MGADVLVAIPLLVIALALFVVMTAAEAAVAAANRTRLRGIAAERGSTRAERLRNYADERASVLAVLAIARTFAAVVVTALAAFLALRGGDAWPAVAGVIVVGVVALALLDAASRLLVAKAPDEWGIRLVPVVRMCRTVFGPVAWAVDRSLRTAFGENGNGGPAQAEEELLRLAKIETNGEMIEDDEREMIRGVIGLDETTAREIMAPRIDIVGLDVSETLDDALRLIVERGFSRIPLYDETIDNIVGIIYAKDLLRCITEGRRPALRDIARPAYFIPESKRVDELLAELRKSKVHIAIVVDEYGGTAGLVTIEDLLEEIVGEIQDEYDREEAPIERVNETEAVLDARVTIDALHELFGFEVDDDEDYDTVGGFVYHHLGKVPAAGDEVRVDGLTLRVLSVLGRRIKKVRARKVEEPSRNGASPAEARDREPAN